MSIRESHLKNGLTLVTKQNPAVKTAAMLVKFNAGVWDTDDRNEGVPHFLEHMMFNRCGDMASQDVWTAFDNLGAEVNAYTWYAETVYYITGVAGPRFEKACELLCQMLSDHNFQDIEKERGIILEEVKRRNDINAGILGYESSKDAWGDHPFGRDGVGSIEQVENITVEDLEEFYSKYYVPENCTVVVAGDVDHKKLMALVRKNLVLPTGEKNVRELPEPEFNTDTYRLHADCQQSEVSLDAYVNRKIETVKDRMMLRIFNDVFGCGTSSRLFVEVREKRSLAYGVSGRLTLLNNYVMLFMDAGVSPENVDITIEVMEQVLEEMLDFGMTEEELNRGRLAVIKNIVHEEESTRGTAFGLLSSMNVHNTAVDIDTTLTVLDSITLDDINEFIGTLDLTELKAAYTTPAKKGIIAWISSLFAAA
jgi:predicted Zn-dependent peptidase